MTMENKGRARTFGLVSGFGMGAGIFYYQMLVDAHLARGLKPHIVMVHGDVRHAMSLAVERKVDELAEYLASLLRQLAGGGAEIASIPAFAPQVCAKELAAITPLPLISLLDAIAAEIERREFKRVALFGARVTMETKMFGRLEGVEVIMPTAREVDSIANIYGRIVEKAQASPEDFEYLRGLAHELIKRERLDGIVLAGTDLALVFNPENIDFANINGARVHIEAIMREIAPAK
jgi:aspartate racemase